MFAIFVPNFLSSSNLRLRKCHSCQEPISGTLKQEAVFDSRHFFLSACLQDCRNMLFERCFILLPLVEDRAGDDWATLLIHVAFWSKLEVPIAVRRRIAAILPAAPPSDKGRDPHRGGDVRPWPRSSRNLRAPIRAKLIPAGITGSRCSTRA